MRTHAQAHAVGPLLNVVMGAVGGVMVPTSVMPAAMQSVARLSPMNWSLEALLGVLVRGTPLTALASQLLPLLAMALVSLAAAAWRLHRPVPA
jgi:ABC-2 type transport system permease protein